MDTNQFRAKFGSSQGRADPAKESLFSVENHNSQSPHPYIPWHNCRYTRYNSFVGSPELCGRAVLGIAPPYSCSKIESVYRFDFAVRPPQETLTYIPSGVPRELPGLPTT
jgi:hypothetical protein